MKMYAGLLCAVGMTGAANAGDVLWDQSGVDPTAGAFVDQAFGDFPDYSTYMVNDVNTGPGWNVTGVTTYFTNGGFAWPTTGSAVLNVFAKDSGMPGAGDDPTTGTIVEFTAAAFGDGLAITAAVDLDLAAGEYWIGLTPLLDFGLFGQEFHSAAPIVGADTYARNPAGAFGVGTDWGTVDTLFGGAWAGVFDAAMLIEGTVVPAPGAAALLVGGLLARRRRRA